MKKLVKDQAIELFESFQNNAKIIDELMEYCKDVLHVPGSSLDELKSALFDCVVAGQHMQKFIYRAAKFVNVAEKESLKGDTHKTGSVGEKLMDMQSEWMRAKVDINLAGKLGSEISNNEDFENSFKFKVILQMAFVNTRPVKVVMCKYESDEAQSIIEGQTFNVAIRILLDGTLEFKLMGYGAVIVIHESNLYLIKNLEVCE